MKQPDTKKTAMELSNIFIAQTKKTNEQFNLLMQDRNYLIYQDMLKELNLTKKLISETLEADTKIETQGFKFTKGHDSITNRPNNEAVKDLAHELTTQHLWLIEYPENKKDIAILNKLTNYKKNAEYKDLIIVGKTKARTIITAPKEKK